MVVFKFHHSSFISWNSPLKRKFPLLPFDYPEGQSILEMQDKCLILSPYLLIFTVMSWFSGILQRGAMKAIFFFAYMYHYEHMDLSIFDVFQSQYNLICISLIQAKLSIFSFV